MKKCIAILALLLPAFAQAQTGTDILFTKGAELEYKTMSARAKGFKTELYEITRITLIVTNVVDSNGVTYSFITKRGRGIEKPDRDFYERKLVAVKAEDHIEIPQDLYAVDTSYLADKYSSDKRAKGYNVATKFSGIIYIKTGQESGKLEYLPKTVETKITMRDWFNNDMPAGPNGQNNDFTSLKEVSYTLKVAIGEMKYENKLVKITTPAGTFDCYVMRNKASIGGGMGKVEQEGIVYFHPQIGFIKSEQANAKVQTGYIELVRLKE